MSSFISSPVWGAVIAIVGAALTGVVSLMFRMLSQISKISDKVDAVAEDVTELKNDDDIVRWSDLGRSKLRRRKSVI
jgi:hypothetical protein